MSRQTALEVSVVIVGGGLSGVCAALAAARHGARTVLIHDRPVLGGNSSSEIRVHICGADESGARPHARESGILEELRLEEAVRNPQRCATMWDLILWEKVSAEPNITLLLNTACDGAETGAEGRIAAVLASRPGTEERFRVGGRLFIDCSGDGRLGAEAGAAWRCGREGPEEFGEPHAEGPDPDTMGASLMWQARDMGHPVPFQRPAFAHHYETCEELPHRGHEALEHGHWWVEYGGELDTIADGEAIRDELLACMMGVWDHVKNHCPRVDARNWALTWFGFVPGKRESRRLLGDYILTENDLLRATRFEDAVCHGGWSLDTHPPAGIRSPEPPSAHIHCPDMYDIPLRSLSSRSVPNLLMAGRIASCTHMAMGSTRVAATGAVMGQAAGTAAALCVARGCLPRDVATQHIAELQQALVRDDVYLVDRRLDDPWDRARTAQVRASSEAPGSPASAVTNGVTRWRGGEANQWASAAGEALPQWIEVQLPEPQWVSEVHLTFDTGFERALTLTHSDWFNGRMVRGPQPETVRHYRVLGQSAEGEDWIPLAGDSGNYQRKRVHPVSCKLRAIRVVVEATHGDPQARLFEIRAY
jgi:hypothetical protein